MRFPHEAKAREILRRYPVIDLHCDTLLRWKKFNRDIREASREGPYGQNSVNLYAHTDLPRLRAAGFGGAFMGVHSAASPAGSASAWETLVKQVNVLRDIGASESYVDVIGNLGGLGSFYMDDRLTLCPGIEGAHMLEPDQGSWERLLAVGAGYVTLCHMRSNWAATCSYQSFLARFGMYRYPDRPAESRLEPKGVEFVKFLADMGIAVDVTHVNSVGLRHACEIMRERNVPVICSHTGYRGTGCAPRPRFRDIDLEAFVTGDYEEQYRDGHKDRHDVAFRNISRKDAEAIRDTDGLIGVLVAPMYLVGGRRFWESGTIDEHASIEHSSRRIAEHIIALRSVVSARHIGIGTDYDGLIDLPRDQRGCSDFVAVIGHLIDLGMTEEELAGVLRGNALRVLGKIWRGRDEAKREAVVARQLG